MPNFFDYARIANRLVAASPTAYALVKRLWDRYQGDPDGALREILERGPRPDWPAPTRGKVLFYVPRFWRVHTSWQLVMAYALRAEGYVPEFVGCGAAARVCENYPVEMGRGGFCTYCRDSMAAFFEPTGFRYRTLGDFVDQERARATAAERVKNLSLEQCKAFEHEGIPFGKLVEPSVARGLRQVMFEPDELTLNFYRGFIETALVNHEALKVLLEEPFAFALMLNGKFVAEAVLLHMARARGLDCVLYERGFRRDTLFFAVNAQVTDFDVTKHYETVKDRPLTDAEEARLRAYEAKRRVGQEAIIQYFPEIDEDEHAIVSKHGVDTRKKIAVMFPNIVWDTAVFGHERTFESIWGWVRTTLEAYRAMPDWTLIVRIHPAEVQLPVRTRETMLMLIEKSFPKLPPNIRIVPPTDKASSYVLSDLASRVIVYSSTMGLEAAMSGKEVITAARTHYAEQGFTKDARDPQHYKQLLAAPLADEAESERTRALARRYANLFFYRFHVPVKSFTEPRLSLPQYRFSSVRELMSGEFPEVEFVRHDLLPLEPGCRVRDAAAGAPGAEDDK